MKGRRSFCVWAVLALLASQWIGVVCASGATGEMAAAASLSTRFTYQGQLRDPGGPVNATCDLQFSLWDAQVGGTQVGSTIVLAAVVLQDGLFTAGLDFGPAAFQGQARWLEVAASCPAGSGYVTFEPRQELTASPYALYARTAPWSGLAGVPADLLDGDDDTTYLPGPGLSLQGTTFAADSTYLQRRVSVSCAAGSSIQSIAEDGTVTCEEDDDSGGDVTAVYAGTGLSGGGTTGPVTVTLDIGYADVRYVNEAQGDSVNSAMVVNGALTSSDFQDGAALAEILDDDGSGSGLDADLLDEQQGSYYLDWDNLTGVPAGLADGVDDDTTYKAGVGLLLSGTQFSIGSAYLLPQGCGNGQIAEWQGSVWICGNDDTGAGGAFWSLTGNAGTSPATHFLGTTDNQALEVRVNNARVLRIEPDATSPNLIGGHSANDVTDGVFGATIGGGGTSTWVNQVTDHYGTVGGGIANRAGDDDSTLLSAPYATVGGGVRNTATDDHATVGGGHGNAAGGVGATIGGGYWNVITTTAHYGTIGGGRENTTADQYATVGGGYVNKAEGYESTVAGGADNVAAYRATVSGGLSNRATGHYATAGGGMHNQASANFATIAGGGPSDPASPDTTRNRVTDTYGTIGGGGNNLAGDGDGDAEDATYATVAGGWRNEARAAFSSIAGGFDNEASGQHSAVGGGIVNHASGYAATIAGGHGNEVLADFGTIGGGGRWALGNPDTANRVTDEYGTIGGGSWNQAGDGDGDPESAHYATVAGGSHNIASGLFAAVGGGAGNWATGDGSFVGGGAAQQCIGMEFVNLASGANSTIAGGACNVADGSSTTIAGGGYNRASNYGASIGGGDDNTASGIFATVGGGYDNFASGDDSTIGGGRLNRAEGYQSTVSGGVQNRAGYRATVSGGFNNEASGPYAAVGGGSQHVASGDSATIPGGYQNEAAGTYSFAGGRQAKALHQGSFVWADSNGFDFASLVDNSFKVRATGGVRFVVGIDGSGNTTWSCVLNNGSAWSCSSDRNLKENFQPVDGREVLERLSQVPIQTWNAKGTDPDIRHMGPAAQDFYAAFGLGEDDKQISTVDTDGVALAAIQGLAQLNQELEAENAAQQAQIDSLEVRLAGLEAGARLPGSWLLLGGGIVAVGLVAGRRVRGGGR